jgi:hypothetical protein
MTLRMMTELRKLVEAVEDDLYDLDWFDMKTTDRIHRIRELLEQVPVTV